MHFSTSVLALSAALTSASPLQLRHTAHAQHPVVAANYDTKCTYPLPDPLFNLHAYLGTWYQVAGTPFGPTTGARCVTAQYNLNSNGTIRVENRAQVGPQPISVVGYATRAPVEYGLDGVFNVMFPEGAMGAGGSTGGDGEDCPGPNYIVQDYCGDFAIVQTQNWGTLYILSRVREPGMHKVGEWIQRAVDLGSDPENIMMFNQTGCS